MRSVLTLATFELVCLLAIAGCAPQGPPPISAGAPARQAELSPQQARQAVLELVRAHPDLFIGRPDADKLGALPLEDRGQGEYAFGAFVVNPSARWYRAEIGHDAPEVYFYRGAFVPQDGQWIAAAPEVQRAHHQGPRGTERGK